jgi:DNA-directed RNA polymerase beta' subunit
MNQEKIGVALSRDLKKEHSLAFRYLQLAQHFRTLRDERSADDILHLASESVSHSEYIRRLLTKLGIKPDNTFNVFGGGFKDINKTLISSYNLEKMMAKEYTRLAKEIGPKDPHYKLMERLANWEVWHMKRIHAVMMRRQQPPAAEEPMEDVIVNKDVDGKVDEMAEELATTQMELDDKDMLLMIREKEIEQLKKEVQTAVAEAMEMGLESFLSKAEEHGLKSEDMGKIGIPAEDMLTPEDIDLLWSDIIGGEYEAFCLNCRNKTLVMEAENVIGEDMKPGVKGKCSECEGIVFTHV